MLRALNPWIGFPSRRATPVTKNATSSGMSPARFLNGGTSIGNTFKRYSRSGRNVPSFAARARSRLVAAMTRTFTRTVRLLPTGSNSCSCSTRSSLTCASIGSSPTSPRKMVPPCASSNRPTRLSMAPAVAQASCPAQDISSGAADHLPDLVAERVHAWGQISIFDFESSNRKLRSDPTSSIELSGRPGALSDRWPSGRGARRCAP